MANGARAGFLATLLMLTVQLIWRLSGSAGGVVPAFPEFIVAAVARLTPLAVFGTVTETYGSLAKKLLFVAVMIGIIATGRTAGVAAEAISQRRGGSGGARLLAGLTVAGALLGITGLVILPVAYLGVFAIESSYTSEIVTQLTVTFTLFGLAWSVLSRPAVAGPDIPQEEPSPMTEHDISRRSILRRGLWSGATVAGLASVGGLTWRLINPPRPGVDETLSIQTAQDIVATQRAGQGAPPSTPPASSEAMTRETASLDSDMDPVASAAQDDPFAYFSELEESQGLTPVLTPVPDFYRVSKNIFDPEVSATDWTLTIGGLVNNPLTLTYDQLLERATVQNITTLGCISNLLNGNLIGTAQWTGVPLVDILREAGVQEERTVDLRFHCADDYEDSIPLIEGLNPDTMIVVAMNGEPLSTEHGFPARLIVPPIYGMKNVKWLDRIEAVDEDFLGFWQTRGWSDTAPYQIWGRIDYPGDEEIAPGPTAACGVASAGDRGIQRVEVSLDDGATWGDATLEPSLNPPFTWVRWAFEFDAQPGRHSLVIRATDGEGTVMDEEQRPPLPDGATGWPSREIRVRDS